MNRLQKKCVIVSAGAHLLLLLILLVGPAFFSPGPKGDDVHVLDVIPANLIDAPFNNPGAGAAPAPAVAPSPPPPPPPPVVTPIAPPPPPEKTGLPELKPVERPKTGQSSKIQISTQLVMRTAPKGGSATDAARARAVQNILRSLKSGLSSGTGPGASGGGGAAYANYRDAVYSAYYHAWVAPASIANEEENIVATVVIASDGTVLNARIVTPSGDAPVDASVQRTLERVTFIAPFPKGAPEKERTYTINFNPKAKRMLE